MNVPEDRFCLQTCRRVVLTELHILPDDNDGNDYMYESRRVVVDANELESLQRLIEDGILRCTFRKSSRDFECALAAARECFYYYDLEYEPNVTAINCVAKEL